MLMILKMGVTQQQIDKLVDFIEKHKLKAHVSIGETKSIVGIIGDESKISKEHLESFDFVEKVMPVQKPYRRASREIHPENTVIDVKGVKIGGNEITMIAGPCSIESEEQAFEIATALKKMGVKVYRGSAYKPRTSPYAFQGLGLKALKILRKIGDELGLVVETELMDIRNIEVVAKHVDMIRIGARNTQNFDLLKEVGKVDKPIILKNGVSTTMEEWLFAAEYILNEGNNNVILCERGIRTYEPATRNTLNLSVIPILKELTHLPVIVDPCHAAGKRGPIPALSKASVAVGADGLLIEVHNNPQVALSDAAQQLTPKDFEILYNDLKRVAKSVDRTLV
ncbi:MAG: 3-deoxy-7-phosphoheptulonate synthase [Candidatus Diapherotrites archaeon CG11_big_fil_rev_8_21_14_0_20_37_9]|nr:MAG: 3-deoxy-7-phosphoheptulonate synthase [Candidatus Diapherotrites archaeon CG11_big_fil_rev_8_21_14_0_20_37_9]